MAERVFSIVTKPETAIELYEIIRNHVQTLHTQGLKKQVGFDVMSSGRVILLTVRGSEEDVPPADALLETVLTDAFVEQLEALSEELVDGFYVPSFAHCDSEKKL